VKYVGGLEDLYVKRGPDFVCAYCGDTADTLDHTIPRCVVFQQRIFYSTYRLIKVSSCRLCNSVLGNVILTTFLSRRRFLEKHFSNRWKPYVEIPDWTEAELSELGQSMRDSIRASMVLRDFYAARLSTLRSHVLPSGVPNDLLVRKRVYWV
jgi:hypothetical protein